jgi:hypothetical protein
MSADVLTHRLPLNSLAGTAAMKGAAQFWFGVTVVGQWAFLYYILAFYGHSSLRGDFQAWGRNELLLKGFVAGDSAGNLVFAAHALLAAVITFGGALQLVPQIRARAMALHRWNGRLFLVAALAVSASGLYLVWVRGARGGMAGSVGITLNAALIMVFAALAWRAALSRDVSAHRRWALRTYLVVNGQWFIRVGMVAWMILGQGHDGGFYRFWSFGCYLVPLAVLELYLRARDGAGPGARFAVAGGLVVLTVFMGLGILGLTLFYGDILK